MPNEIIAFDDAEGLVINYLSGVLDNDTSISTQVPKVRPTKMVRVSRVGGTKVRLNAESAMLIIECWDKDSVSAFALARSARAYINALAGDWLGPVWVYRVQEIAGPQFFPDPSTNLPRYQFTVALDLKGEKL